MNKGENNHDELIAQLLHILSSSTPTTSEDEFLDQLVPIISNSCLTGREEILVANLAGFSEEKELEIENLSSESHQGFVQFIQQLLQVRQDISLLEKRIVGINEDVQSNGGILVRKKGKLIELFHVRQNIDDAVSVLRVCLRVLALANRVKELVQSKKHFAALRTLDELQSVHLKEVSGYKFALRIRESIGAMHKWIQNAVLADLKQWLYSVREKSAAVGLAVFERTDIRRQQRCEQQEQNPLLNNGGFNNAVQLVCDELDEFDPVQNERVRIDFGPLYECIHIHKAMDALDDLRLNYEGDRRMQKELLLSQSTGSVPSGNGTELRNLLAKVAGFAIIEKITMKRALDFRSSQDVNDLWYTLCGTLRGVLEGLLPALESVEALSAVKNELVLFVQAVEVYGYSATAVEALILQLFEKYAAILKKQFAKDFSQIVAEDDFMPMVVGTPEEFHKLAYVSWFDNDHGNGKQSYPCVLPFSQLYPLCCIDIRNFVNNYYQFAEDFSQHRDDIDDTLKKSLDDLLIRNVNDVLIETLKTRSLEQIAQTFINFEHFGNACEHLEALLVETRSTHRGGQISLHAKITFQNSRKLAEKRIFEVVNEKIDELLDFADYDWHSSKSTGRPSVYLEDMVQFLNNVMNSTLVNLPREIKSFLYLEALDHLADQLLELLLNANVRKISDQALSTFDNDIQYLEEFVKRVGDPNLYSIFDEVRQSVNLMLSSNPQAEYQNIDSRMRKYGRIKPQNAAILTDRMTFVKDGSGSTFGRFLR